MRHRVWQALALLTAAAVLTSCANWRGIANVPLPGGPGTGADSYTVYVQMPDTLALNANSRVRVADVFVGTVRSIELKNWVAVLTVGIQKGVRLPKNATASIGQTSLLGSQHVELAAPANPSPEPLTDGDTIPLQNSSAYPTTERTLASVATVLRGGGIPNLEVIQNEIYNMLSGRAEEIREFLGKLATFTAELNAQRDDITHAIDSIDRLLTYVAERSDTLDRVLTEFPPLIKHFADTQNQFTDAIDAVGRLSAVTDRTLSAAQANLHTDLQALQRPLRELGRASPLLLQALKLMLTAPFDIDAVPKAVRGDYINLSGNIDLTLSAIDNGILTGTGLSGMLRALEQSWGRDPATMLPDVRFTPNPNNVPGGPLVERSE
ncbi:MULTISPECIES: virulence factor Mce family protein [unclassified Mycobacterium]|uniref:virulence factor Mce family protein n=1 Tax=unclassified Mycobacterium TaxID=2642494 RepID=UPI0007400B5F|nr:MULTISPECIES: virulence factor Mce family protein [unclassified Mycobacterium]KUH82865.1 mammalian cell entry protein [Mycobacterium sp. IS-1556]KUH83449.1 mammalian cell entry protein [Mycobacterium sp. GA-0227b]KUH84488.1 mammalian cell entry protein [Mycobacterium sp. GA-1999]